jgi:hypothetical protein
MSAIAFMPWCRIDRDYDLGEIQIIRFMRGQSVERVAAAAQGDLQKILGTYKDIKAQPIDEAALLVLRGKGILDDLNDDERDLLYENVEIVRFGGLANREYFNALGPYCNSDCFTCYVQRFSATEFTSLNSRRREGSTQSMWPLDEISITVPLHCSSVRQVVLDDRIVAALFAYRRDHPKEWGRWINAISGFTQANTDAENFRYQVEWLLLCSAFEHLLEAESKAIDVAAKFSGAFVPSQSKLARDAIRRSARWRDEGQPLRFEWMREFYRIRGDFAHGKLETAQDMVWGLGEHLVLATISFPLLVKIMLANVGTYVLTDDDVSQIEAFEAFADTPRFTYPPADARSSIDSHWNRLQRGARRTLVIKQVVAELEQVARNRPAAAPDDEAGK